LKEYRVDKDFFIKLLFKGFWGVIAYSGKKCMGNRGCDGSGVEAAETDLMKPENLGVTGAKKDCRRMGLKQQTFSLTLSFNLLT
jgi:hypothetical protein